MKGSLTLAFIGIGIVILGGLFFAYAGFNQSTDSLASQDLTLSSSGKVLTGDNKVIGKATFRNGKVEIHIPIAEEQNYYPSLTLHLPKPITKEEIGISINSIQGTEGMYSSLIDDSTITASFGTVLPESHTVLQLEFPESYLTLPFGTRLWGWLTSLPISIWIFATCLEIIFTYLFFKIRTFRQSHTVKESRSVPPDDLQPIELAILVKGNLYAQEFASLLYSLGNRGYIEIIDSGNEVHFLRTSKETEGLNDYEDAILSFVAPHHGEPKSLDQLIISLIDTSIFSNFASLIYLALYDSLNARGYFTENITSIHLRFKTIGIIIQLIGLSLIAGTYFSSGQEFIGLLLFGASTFLSGYILYKTGYSIIPLTSKGVKVTQQALAFKNFLQDSTPLDDTSQGEDFFAYLPYSLIFGSEKVWLERFIHSRVAIPQWLTLTNQEVFEPSVFVAQMQRITSSFSRVFVKVKNPNVD